MDVLGDRIGLAEAVSPNPSNVFIAFQRGHHVGEVVGESLVGRRDFVVLFEQASSGYGRIAFLHLRNELCHVFGLDLDRRRIFNLDGWSEPVGHPGCGGDPLAGFGFGVDHVVRTKDESLGGDSLGKELVIVEKQNGSRVAAV